RVGGGNGDWLRPALVGIAPSLTRGADHFRAYGRRHLSARHRRSVLRGAAVTDHLEPLLARSLLAASPNALELGRACRVPQRAAQARRRILEELASGGGRAPSPGATRSPPERRLCREGCGAPRDRPRRPTVCRESSAR